MSRPFQGSFPYPLHHIHKESTLSTIAEVEKNSKERIRVSIEEYRDHKFIDCRVYYEDKDGQPRNADTIDEVITALQKGSEILEEQLSPIKDRGTKEKPTLKLADNRTVSDKVRAWVSSVNGNQFSVKDGQRALGLTEPKQAHLVNVVFAKLAEEGLIERTGQGRGIYRRIAA